MSRRPCQYGGMYKRKFIVALVVMTFVMSAAAGGWKWGSYNHSSHHPVKAADGWTWDDGAEPAEGDAPEPTGWTWD